MKINLPTLGPMTTKYLGREMRRIKGMPPWVPGGWFLAGFIAMITITFLVLIIILACLVRKNQNSIRLSKGLTYGARSLANSVTHIVQGEPEAKPRGILRRGGSTVSLPSERERERSVEPKKLLRPSSCLTLPTPPDPKELSEPTVVLTPSTSTEAVARAAYHAVREGKAPKFAQKVKKRREEPPAPRRPDIYD